MQAARERTSADDRAEALSAGEASLFAVVRSAYSLRRCVSSIQVHNRDPSYHISPPFASPSPVVAANCPFRAGLCLFFQAAGLAALGRSFFSAKRGVASLTPRSFAMGRFFLPLPLGEVATRQRWRRGQARQRSKSPRLLHRQLKSICI